MIHFRHDPTTAIAEAIPIYIAEDYAFDVDPRPEGCALSVSVNELQLMVDEDDHRVVFVEGYCPHTGWRQQKLMTPKAHKEALFVIFDERPVPGVSRRVSGDARWPAFVDPSSGWICIGDEVTIESNISIEFAPKTIAVLDLYGRLVSLWLRPVRLPKDITNFI